MEISCLPVSFFDPICSGEMPIRKFAALARDAGLQNIDFSSMFLRAHVPTYLEAVRRDLQAEGMKLKMLTTYPDFSHPDPLQRERELSYLMCDIAAASFLGAPYVRITAGQRHEGGCREETLESVAGCFLRAADYAGRMGVTLVYENHAKPGAWDRVDFSYPTDIFLELVRRTEGSSIQVNFDTANPVAYRDEEEPMAILPQVFHRLGTVHVADTSTKGALNHTVIGTGLVRFREIFSFLKKNGYDGLFSIEEGSGTGMEGIKTAVAFVQKAWEEA